MVKYLLLFGGGVVLSWGLTPLVRRLAIRLKAMDVPDPRKVHTQPIPRMGGLAIFFSFITVLFFAFSPFALVHTPFLAIDPHWWTGFLSAATIVMALGIVDDLKPLGARVKFLIQVLAALVAMYFGYQIHELNLPGGTTIPLGAWKIPVTLLWIVGLTNAFNLIDGLDGLASGVAFISTVTLMGVALLGQNVELALLCATLAGCLLGFLRYNFHPASIFLGDSGSLFLGFTLAVLSITASQKSTVVVSLIIPMLAFGLPIMDTLLAMIRRLLRSMHVWETTEQGTYRVLFMRGKTMFEADRDHIHHRLMRVGLYHRNAVVFLYVICAALGVTALAITFSENLNNGLVLIAIGLAVILGIRKLRYEELQLLRNGALVPLSRFSVLGLQSFQIPTDLVMVSLAYYAAFWLRFEGAFQGDVKSDFINTLPAVLLAKIVLFHVSGLYKLRWRRAGVAELWRGLCSMILGSITAAIALACLGMSPVSHALLVIDFYVMASLLLGLRFSVRMLEYFVESNPARKQRVLIYGAGPTASLLVHELLSNQQHGLTPVGFIDESPQAKQKLLSGYPIFGPPSALDDVLMKGDIQEMIIAVPKLSAERFEEITELCRHHRVRVRRFKVSLEDLNRPAQQAAGVNTW